MGVIEDNWSLRIFLIIYERLGEGLCVTIAFNPCFWWVNRTLMLHERYLLWNPQEKVGSFFFSVFQETFNNSKERNKKHLVFRSMFQLLASGVGQMAMFCVAL